MFRVEKPAEEGLQLRIIGVDAVKFGIAAIQPLPGRPVAFFHMSDDGHRMRLLFPRLPVPQCEHQLVVRCARNSPIPARRWHARAANVNVGHQPHGIGNGREQFLYEFAVTLKVETDV